MQENVEPLIYQDVLKEIRGKENHLLLANGFNYGLGVHTGYKDIFNKMLENNHGIYTEAKPFIERCNYDLEMFLGEITKYIYNNEFLKKYVCNKIKLDFMQALHEIVKSHIKNVYAKKNEGIYLLLQNFTNYFTLNYDSFLYLLLLNFKPINQKDRDCFAFHPLPEFIENELNENHQNIYNEIKHTRESGKLSLSIDNRERTQTDCDKLSKIDFKSAIRQYAKNTGKNWKDKEIDKTINLLLENEKKNAVLKNVDDGSRQLPLFEDQYVFDTKSKSQNLFFLHGATHIIKDRDKTIKITQDSSRALYQKLEEILNSNDKEIVCVFQAKNKLEAIKKDPYLSHCYEKLKTLSGNMVIIGSSLADNDNHIFNQINESKIEKIYISSTENELKKYEKLIKEIFPNKETYLFLAESISYEINKNQI